MRAFRGGMVGWLDGDLADRSRIDWVLDGMADVCAEVGGRRVDW